ncbi:MAG: redox-regulated ATPase YchF [Alphaproteobacteria bacterium CG11_big_fil_rev_8_21_14_0_20_44_7]|nr:MAG: redox-regulated ATPase YchF [Alphaproteobacteria bacterium CG11_big_fil_rev_8_21_14_0_20_44_7]
MGLKVGIVGLPNIGKSTLFNALTSTAAAEAANYPFCTIEPNTGIVSVPDERMRQLAQIAGSQQIIPTQLEFTDIAGLVKGASQGEGLGNKFLSHIREMDAIAHVLRCFEDDDITHVEGNVDPIRDAEIIETELILADLESIDKRMPALEKRLRGQDEEAKEIIKLLERIKPLLDSGKPARNAEISTDELQCFKNLQLITAKPVLYVCNVDESEAANGNEYTKRIEEKAQQENAQMVVISAKIESEVALLETDEEKQEFLQDLGLTETGLSKLIKSAYKLLELITYFTVGPKETRAWTIKISTPANKAAGVIHTDFERGFICAETVKFADYIEYKGEQGAKDKGKLRVEGKDYIVTDGDVLHFRFNV